MASTLTLLLGLALLVVTATRLAAALGIGSPTTFVVAVYAIANAELVLVALGLSLARGFTPLPIMTTLALISGVTLVATRRHRVQIAWRTAAGTVADDPALLVLAIVAVLAFAYTLALAIGTPQVEDDVLTFHLVRAGLWRQHHGIAYLTGIFDLRNNAYPPGGEVASLYGMTLSGNEHFVALGQLLAVPALAVGAVGVARRVGFSRRQALFGGLLVPTLPIVALQAGTAMSDLVVASYLVAAALFLLDGRRASPWLAGLATALAMDVKLTAPLGLPLLLALAWIAQPVVRRRTRLVAVAAGALAGAFWYVVNLAETGTWDGHVTEEFHVDRGLFPILARIARLGIELVDLSGGAGRDRWLYAVAALVVAAVGAIAVRRRLVPVGVAAVLTLVPIALPSVAHALVRVYFKAWTVLGHRELADLDPGHDITRAASNFSWFGPLGSLALVAATVLVAVRVRRNELDVRALLLALAPAYWLVAFSVLFFYQEWAGRFFVFPLTLAAATWGSLLRLRAATWAVVAIAATTSLLALANDARRPSGLPLLEREKPRSIWRTPDWMGGPETRRDYDAPIRFLDERVPGAATVGLAITPSDPVYPFFGTGLDRRVTFVRAGDRTAPGAAWVFVRPGEHASLCASGWRTALVTDGGWRILRRAGNC